MDLKNAVNLKATAGSDNSEEIEALRSRLSDLEAMLEKMKKESERHKKEIVELKQSLYKESEQLEKASILNDKLRQEKDILTNNLEQLKTQLLQEQFNSEFTRAESGFNED